MANNPFVFEWPVDQNGYELEHLAFNLDFPEGSFLSPGARTLGDEAVENHRKGRAGNYWVRARGGPPRYYLPLEHQPGLWREFAEACSSIEGVLAFVGRFGLLAEGDHDEVSQILSVAERIRVIAACLDRGDRQAASKVLSGYPPRLTEPLRWNERAARFEAVLVPTSLRDALLHQAAETIAQNYQWRRCGNEGCSHWFRVGTGAATIRRDYCSNRCRVASARRQKQAADGVFQNLRERISE